MLSRFFPAPTAENSMLSRFFMPPHSDALTILVALPAPDLLALAAKLDVIVPQLASELTGCEDCLERLRQDAHGLAAGA